MTVERSVGAIVFRQEGGEILYLLLHYPSMNPDKKAGHWEFARGHIEKGEKTEEALRREVEEETGIGDLKIIAGFKETIRIWYVFEGERRLKYAAYFVAETETKEVKISSEHLGYAWLNFTEALSRLNFKNSKELLEKANDFLVKSIKVIA